MHCMFFKNLTQGSLRESNKVISEKLLSSSVFYSAEHKRKTIKMVLQTYEVPVVDVVLLHVINNAECIYQRICH